MKQVEKIGWVGLGNMGTPMVLNLLSAGYKVSVYNRTREKEKDVLEGGAVSAAGLGNIAEANDIIFVMVTDDVAVKEIFSPSDGLLSADVTGKLFVNVSTVASDTSIQLNELCKERGARFLEVPVSGSVKPAQDGTLIMLAGGDEVDYHQAKPMLDVLGKLSLLLGTVGTASAAKLAINYFLALNIQGLAESVLFARENGVSTADMLTIINEGAVGSGITKLKSAAILVNDFPAAFALKHMAKDMRLAEEQGLKFPLSKPVFESFKRANDQGLGDEDVMAIYKFLNK